MDLFRTPWLLSALLPTLLGAWALARWSARRRNRLLQSFGDPRTLSRLSPSDAEPRRRIKFGLQCAAVSLILVALAGPQWGIELVTSEAMGVQVFVALDTSLSMLAEDLKPNRFEKAKSEMSQILSGLKGQRVGIIAFSGKARVQCPLTTDIDAARSILGWMQVGMIPQSGTAIAEALETATALLSRYPGQKAFVLLTDGEDRRPGALAAAKAAEKAGVRVYVIGVGTPEGEPIPLRDAQGASLGYKKDRSGSTVISKLGEEGLIELAAAASGAYYRASPQENEAASVLQHILQMEKSRIDSGSSNLFKNRYRVPLLLAALLLAAELLMADTRAAAAALLLIAPLSGCGRQKSALDIWSGNRAYHAQRYDEALERYSRRSEPRASFNTADAQYKLGRFDEAAQNFSQFTDTAAAKGLAPAAWYNQGNSLYRQGQYAAAAEAYKRCLLLDPKDEDCRFNLIKSLEARVKPPQKSQQPRDQKDQKNEPGGAPPPPPRPQGMSPEDAQRVLQAVRDKEQGLARQQMQRRGAKQQKEEEDW